MLRLEAMVNVGASKLHAVVRMIACSHEGGHSCLSTGVVTPWEIVDETDGDAVTS